MVHPRQEFHHWLLWEKVWLASPGWPCLCFGGQARVLNLRFSCLCSRVPRNTGLHCLPSSLVYSVLFLRRGCTIYSWLSGNVLCRSGWTWTQEVLYFSASSSAIKDLMYVQTHKTKYWCRKHRPLNTSYTLIHSTFITNTETYF